MSENGKREDGWKEREKEQKEGRKKRRKVRWSVINMHATYCISMTVLK